MCVCVCTPVHYRDFITESSNRDKQPSMLTLTPRVNLESPVNHSSFWMMGRSWSTRRKPKLAQVEHVNSTLHQEWAKLLSKPGLCNSKVFYVICKGKDLTCSSTVSGN